MHCTCMYSITKISYYPTLYKELLKKTFAISILPLNLNFSAECAILWIWHFFNKMYTVCTVPTLILNGKKYSFGKMILENENRFSNFQELYFDFDFEYKNWSTGF